jgi:hypothetical protein
LHPKGGRLRILWRRETIAAQASALAASPPPKRRVR